MALLAGAVAPAALLVSPLIFDLIRGGALSSVAWSRFGTWLAIVLSTSSVFVVIGGIPAFLFLRWRNTIRWWSSIIAGFVVACVPIAFELWPTTEPVMRTTASHWNGQRMVYTIIDGQPTYEGWISFAEIVVAFGLLGALGGFFGWLVWRLLQASNDQSIASEISAQSRR